MTVIAPRHWLLPCRDGQQADNTAPARAQRGLASTQQQSTDIEMQLEGAAPAEHLKAADLHDPA
jgi:hypothetical protein